MSKPTLPPHSPHHPLSHSSTMFQRVLLLAAAVAGTAAQTFFTGRGACPSPAPRPSSSRAQCPAPCLRRSAHAAGRVMAPSPASLRWDPTRPAAARTPPCPTASFSRTYTTTCLYALSLTRPAATTTRLFRRPRTLSAGTTSNVSVPSGTRGTPQLTRVLAAIGPISTLSATICSFCTEPACGPTDLLLSDPAHFPGSVGEWILFSS
jgi:hypothetical protein